MEQFTRRAALLLTRNSLSQLSYLEKAGLIVPQRVSGQGRVAIMYTWEQILEIRAINHLRRQLSVQTIRKIVDFFEEHGFGRTLRDKKLVVSHQCVSWIQFSTTMPRVIQVVGKHNCHTGQLILASIPPFAPVEPAEKDGQTATQPSKVIDFESCKQKLRTSQP